MLLYLLSFILVVIVELPPVVFEPVAANIKCRQSTPKHVNM